MKKNVASQSIGAEMITAADGTAFTGAVTVLITIDNGTQTASAGTAPAHEGNGYHSYTPTQTETNGDHIAFTFTGTGAIPATIQLFTSYPQTLDNDTKISSILVDTGNIDTIVDLIKADTTAILVDTNDLQTNQGNWLTATGFSTFNPTSDAVANVTLVATTTTNTDMRGTNSALLAASYVAPDNASITSILADTNELQLNQGNWLTATGFSTLVATDIVTGGAITTASGNASVDVAKINGTTVIGVGTPGNLWRA